MTNAVARPRILLGAVVVLFALAAWTPGASAGSAQAPEFTDANDDREAGGAIPLAVLDAVSAVSSSTELTGGYVTEEGSDLLVHIMTNDANGLGGNGAAAVDTFRHHYEFRLTVAGTEYTASADLVFTTGNTVGGVATEVLLDDPEAGTLTLRVPKANVGSPSAGTAITGLFASARSDIVVSGSLITITDRAPDTGAGTDYVVTGGGAVGNATDDADNDGLNDTIEVQQFGNVSAQNGTGDPDGDGLNNSAEFNLGTNATLADTDGDGLDDGEDSAPLDPNQPALTNTTDRDNDTLPDLWEREHFNNTAAQNATGDPDADGLNNSAEFQQGTDPNVADTDGDGHDDAEDGAPLDPDSTGHPHDAGPGARPELYSGAAMFAAAATFCLLGLARLL